MLQTMLLAFKNMSNHVYGQKDVSQCIADQARSQKFS